MSKCKYCELLDRIESLEGFLTRISGTIWYMNKDNSTKSKCLIILKDIADEGLIE